MLSVLLFTLASRQAPITITDALVISGVSRGGRRPIPNDAIVSQIVAGTWQPPTAGALVRFGERNGTWRKIIAGKDGSFSGEELGNGYVYVPVDRPENQVLLLTAKGDSLVYVNGALRAGDPYGYGYLHLPVALHQGRNDLLFSVGRGSLSVTLAPMDKPIELQSEDATTPDILTADTGPLWASMTAINGTDEPAKGLQVKAILADGTAATIAIPAVPALSLRKIPFQIPSSSHPQAGPLAVHVELWNGKALLDSKRLSLTVKSPLERNKRTFVSEIDGSIQYFAVDPALKPSPDNALVVTLHGAGVEATGQAAAYGQKDWATIVAATNRRPYGFDWEDIGRSDALEVLKIAETDYPHDPDRVDLTGHSMGGHGTWSVGTLYPGLFASIAPSAGWISFWSYAGGWKPEQGLETEKLLARSMSVGDTMGRVSNTLADDVYILHGDADDNVPVQQARTMKAALEKIGHPHLTYHEQPGAGHWWGNQCVDWPPLFAMIQSARIDPDPLKIDFTAQNPVVSATDGWVTVDQQTVSLGPSRVQAQRTGDRSSFSETTQNVHRLTLRLPNQTCHVSLDGQPLQASGTTSFESSDGHWRIAGPIGDQKSSVRSGPFKSVFNRRFLFVVGTAGTVDENRWAADRARYDAETMLYRGNGAVDVVQDRDYSWRRFRGRNVVLYGNANTNRAWKDLLGKCPVQVGEGHAEAGGKTAPSDSIGGLIVFANPHDRESLVGAICGTDVTGMRGTDRLGLFTSGIAYPDWILLQPDKPAGILADGFFGNDWRIDPAASAWAP